jgi:hypothetical protein
MTTMVHSSNGVKARDVEIVVFFAYFAFIIGGLIFYGMVDDSPFVPLMRDNLPFRLAWFAVEGGSIVALLAFAAGALPIGLAMLHDAVVSKRWNVLLLLALPMIAVAVLITLAAILVALSHGDMSVRSPGYHLFITMDVLLLVTLLASPVAVAFAVRRSTISTEIFRFALIPAVIVILAMVLMFVATLVWGIMAYVLAPQDTTAYAVFGFNALSAWLVIVTLMATSTITAGIILLRNRAVLVK